MLLEKFYTRMKEILSFVHVKRLDSFLTINQALIEGGKLSIANLGNKIINNTTPKHNIKKVDRLIGNTKLEVKEIYFALGGNLLSYMNKAIILVDWCIYENKKFHVLTASLVADGRSIPIYSDVYDIKNSHFCQTTAEDVFLDNLAKCIPSNIESVVIVTDAGFKTPWFHKVTSLGWDYIARLRGTLTLKLNDTLLWKTAKQFYSKATKTPKFLGEAQVGKSVYKKFGITTAVHAYFGPKRNRESNNKRYSKSINKLYKAANKEPWIIVTSLRKLNGNSKKIINIYKKRMQIEQNFRDDKNPRWGLGFRNTECSTANRLSVYLLLAAVAHKFLWLIGYAAEKNGLKQPFQVNTLKRRVLSLINLGKLIVAHEIKLKQEFILEAIKHITSINSKLFLRETS
jgi:hypothetical protein